MSGENLEKEKIVCGIDFNGVRIKVAYKDNVDNEIKTFNLESAITVNQECIDIDKTIYINSVPCDVLAYNRISEMKDETKTIMNMYRVLYELYKRTNVTRFIIGLGVPINAYKSQEDRERLRNKALEKIEVTIREFTAENVTLTIENVIIQPESVYSTFYIEDTNKSDDNFIVDLGISNILIIPYYKASNINETITVNTGYNSLIEDIRYILIKEYGTNIKKEQTERLLERLDGIQDDGVKKIINDYIEENFLLKALEIPLREVGYNELLGHKLIFVGELSLKFKEQICEIFKDAKFAKESLYLSAIEICNEAQKKIKDIELVENQK